VLQDLINAGFTPVNALLLAAIIIGGRVVKVLHAKQTADREAWHTETRQRIDLMQLHIDACDRDRLQLHKDVAILAEKVNRTNHCPNQECPLRVG
jgi:ferredoxin-NADP reductase